MNTNNNFSGVVCLFAVLAIFSGVSSLRAAKPAAKPASRPAFNTVPWTLDHVEDFPAMTADAKGQLWLTVLARPKTGAEIRVYRVEGEQRKLVASFHPAGSTGIDRPAITAFQQGCVIAFSVEINDTWKIAYCYLDGDTTTPLLLFIDASGTINCKPALAAAGNRFCVAWESNATSKRGIYACWVHQSEDGKANLGKQDQAQRISAENANSRNPAMIALKDGSLFAAWDSVREQSANLYGAWLKQGQWAAEQRLTHHPRIERYVSLAANGNEVWLAWQAQSFPQLRINSIEEQLIGVARLDGDHLAAPVGLFDAISKPTEMLMRPRIRFDSQGRLWLTARRSIQPHGGWEPLAWCYSGKEWSQPTVLWPLQGRWRSVDLVFSRDKAISAIQRDDLRDRWENNLGSRPDWHSEVAIVSTDLKKAPPAATLETVPLAMPTTQFSIAKHMEIQAVDLAQQSTQHNGKALHCYFGDLHEHTDLSVCARATNPPSDDLLANQRDIEQLDFTALTDHDFDFDRPQWEYNGERTRINNDAGTFLALLAQEWTSHGYQYTPKRPYRGYGHRNFIFKDSHFDRFLNSFDENNMTPRQAWDKLKGVNFVSIPHQLADLGNCPTDWTFHDEVIQPVAEIYQVRGSYEYLGCPAQAINSLAEQGKYMQDVWKQGLIIGVIASPDHGGGMGHAGVWAEDLTAGDVLDSLRARHSFGTTGAKIALLVQSGSNMMGDRVQRHGTGPIPFSITCTTQGQITNVVLMCNNEVIYEAKPEQSTVKIDWVDTNPPDAPQLWYYVRIHRAGGQMAWSSPIWFVNSTKIAGTTAK